MPEANELAPDFTLPDQDGRPVSLSGLRGRTVLLYFYPKDDTPGCTKEACSLRDAFADITGRDTVVLGVSADGAERHRAFRAKYNLPFSLLTDADHAVMALYGAWGEKKLYGKTSVGVLRSSFLIGPDGRIRKVWRKVDTAMHGAQVLAALGA
jgi:peroxiredoxin Q/BCP